MSRKIEWESWNALELDSYKKEENIPNDLALMNYDERDDTPFIDKEADVNKSVFENILTVPSQIIYTPFGPVPFDSQFTPTKRWDCWIGHTNFDITKSIVALVSNIEGVDILKPLSRYSFCIGIGKLFISREVKQKIQNAISD